MPCRVIEFPGPHTVHTIREAMSRFASLEWTSEKKIPLVVRVHPDSVKGTLPEKIDGVPIEVTTRVRPSVLEMEMLM